MLGRETGIWDWEDIGWDRSMGGDEGRGVGGIIKGGGNLKRHR